ncbi:hypothetical protein S2M10_06710 [Sphingomonas sp. S2M10]|uniref:hypothetical protein n=1 Tax=Sphingomonas sp. S2M10 TaxID=2705010 RepID=UPI001456D16A|nr:hypothetical protein [Sphingomonas sp. S2M10]NLS25701.1 hypothetical protein [Sphingomonas sp. S2M10]
MPVWIQIDAYDPGAGAAITLRAANMDDPATCMAAGGPWWPVIAKAPVLRYDLFDGSFGGEITAPTTDFAVQIEAWPNFARYAIADARVRVWTDIAAEPIFDGRATAQPKIGSGQAEISIKVDDSWLDKPLLTPYAGTTGVEGPAGLKGQPKPLALGAPRYVAGKLIDSVNNVFQVSAYGAVQGFEAALERLARFGAPVANYPTYAALVAAAIPAGAWATCNAQGLARFGAPTNGQISFLVQGDVAGPDGWARKPGQQIRRLALLSGGAGKIHDASLNALDAARPYNLSIYLDQQTTARQVIQSVAASVNAVAGVSWTGKLFVVPVGLAAATMTLAADGSALPPVRSVEQLEVAAPFSKIAVAAERAWTVHALADIAFADPLVDMGVYNNGSYYRPGNIVQWAGATWRYKSDAAPGSGNPPPTPPTASNTWWTVLAQQGPQGDPGAPGSPGADGQTLYEWIAYSDSANGTVNFTTGLPDGRGYQGRAINKTGAIESANPSDYQWSIYRGPAAFGLVPYNDCVVGQDYIVKVGTNTAWDGSAYSSEGFVGGAFLSQTVTSSTPGTILGLNTDPTSSAGWESIDFGFYVEFGALQRLYAAESGALTLLGNWTVGHKLTIVYDNRSVKYYRDGELLRTASAAGGLRLFLDSSLNVPNSRLSDLKFGASGAAGADGFNTATINIFQRGASAPALPSATTTYDFAAKTLTGLNNGWSTTIPAGSAPLWQSAATAASQSGTDTIAATEWAGAVQIATNGANAASSAPVLLYNRTSSPSAPAVPSSNVSYDFGTAIASGINNGWTQSLPATGGPYRWQINATAVSTTGSDTIAPGEWSAPQIMAQDGSNGIDALSVSIAPSAVPVPCTAGGTPKAALPGAQLRVFKGAADVTGSAGYAVGDVSNLSGVSVSGDGVVSVTGIAGGTSALTGFADIAVTKDGASQVVRLVYNKALDGAAYVDGSVNVGAPASTSLATVATLSLLMGPSGTIEFDTSGGFDTSNGAGTINVAGSVDYSLNGSTWTNASSFVGNASVPGNGDGGDWAVTGTLIGTEIGLSSKQTVMLRVQMRKTNTNDFGSFGGSLHATWRG